jgi:hypothetical protein
MKRLKWEFIQLFYFNYFTILWIYVLLCISNSFSEEKKRKLNNLFQWKSRIWILSYAAMYQIQHFMKILSNIFIKMRSCTFLFLEHIFLNCVFYWNCWFYVSVCFFSISIYKSVNLVKFMIRKSTDGKREKLVTYFYYENSWFSQKFLWNFFEISEAFLKFLKNS